MSEQCFHLWDEGDFTMKMAPSSGHIHLSPHKKLQWHQDLCKTIKAVFILKNTVHRDLLH